MECYKHCHNLINQQISGFWVAIGWVGRIQEIDPTWEQLVLNIVKKNSVIFWNFYEITWCWFRMVTDGWTWLLAGKSFLFRREIQENTGALLKSSIQRLILFAANFLSQELQIFVFTLISQTLKRGCWGMASTGKREDRGRWSGFEARNSSESCLDLQLGVGIIFLY